MSFLPSKSEMNFWCLFSLVAQMVKHLPTMQETQVRSLGWEDPLEKEMATHSSTLAWIIPWTEERCRLQSMGSQRVGHDWATSLLFTSLKCVYCSQDCFLLDYLHLGGKDLTSIISKVYQGTSQALDKYMFNEICSFWNSPFGSVHMLKKITK